MLTMAMLAMIAASAWSTCSCPKQYTPHCASDGKTYGNDCKLKCAQSSNPDLKLLYFGRCKAADEPEISCPCTQEYRPTCGTDGITYANPCLLKCVAKFTLKLKPAHEGPCKTNKFSCSCPKINQPVCGSHGTTYANLCKFHCARNSEPGLMLSHHGECDRGDPSRPESQHACACSKEIHLVCGTDGQTYWNLCFLKCAAKKDKKLRIDHEGQCLEELEELEI